MIVVVDLDLEAPGIGSVLLDALPDYGMVGWFVEALYERLFDYLRMARTVQWGMPDDDLRWHLKMVAAQIDGTEGALEHWIDASYVSWSRFYDNEADEPEARAQTFERTDPSAPHHPLPIFFDPRMRGYGLILMLLANDAAGGSVFRKFAESRTRIKWAASNNVFPTPRELTTNDESLRSLIEAIAGEWMGKNPRRGFTYTWVPTHLADAAGRMSPRSFILAFRRAAEHAEVQYPGHPTALHYEAIQQGVTAASEIRIEEIKEDYPWVRPLLEAARGLTVPCESQELMSRWNADRLKEVEQGTDKLPPRRFSTDPFRKGDRVALIDDLVELAVLYRTTDGRLNMPDIFRIAFGIKRRGGVKPPR